MLIAFLAAALAATIQSLWFPLNGDVSWLMSAGDQILSGKRLYVDVLEVNPPISVWMYVPLLWAGHLLAIRPEALVVAAFIAGGLASVLATLRLASALGDSPSPTWLAAGLSFSGLVLPMGLFAEREHAALLLAFPTLAAIALVAHDKPVSRRALYATGIAAGLMVVIKPFFVSAVAIPAVWAAWKRRSVRPLLLPATAATAVILVYGAAILLFTPAYFNWVPVFARVYGPMHAPFWTVLVGPTMFPAICLALAALVRLNRVPPVIAAFAFGAAGFLLAAILQAKNYPNHWLPQAALAWAGTVALLGVPRVEPARRAVIATALALVAAGEVYHWAIRPDPAVAQAIMRVAPPRPTVIALSTELTSGHPVTRNIDGRWVGSRPSLFTASGARFVGLRDPAVRAAYREDIDSFAKDVARNNPDVVLVDRPTKEWLMAEPVIARAMTPYRFAAITKTTEIWVRRDLRR